MTRVRRGNRNCAYCGEPVRLNADGRTIHSSQTGNVYCSVELDKCERKGRALARRRKKEVAA